MRNNKKSGMTLVSTALLATIIIVSVVGGGLVGYFVNNWVISGRINELQSQLSTLQENMTNTQAQNVTNQNNTYFLEDNVSLSRLYDEVKNSVVVIRGMALVSNGLMYYYAQVQGSGFVYNCTGNIVIVTNYHVVQNSVNITVTFINGNGYAATLLGSDRYADLAVLSIGAPQSNLKPLEIVSSSALEVGDPVIAVGNPYGLAGSMTAGIVSALGRTITEAMTGSYSIPDIIQTSTPINSGNSGGPLLTYQGKVVGITTAIISNSQGLGFAIPSSTILREIGSLIAKGSYNQHPSMDAAGIDMTYEIAKAMNTNTTYGWLVVQVTADGPADKAGLKAGSQQTVVAGDYVIIGGDIVIAINGARITNTDDLLTYLEENVLPNQIIDLTIVRNNQTLVLPLTVGAL